MDEWLLKVCIVGSNTDLNHRFGNLTADSRYSKNYLPTSGFDIPIKRLKVDNEIVKLIIVILAGEEFFRISRKGKYRGASGCLILFDKGEKDTFIAIPDWYKEFTDICGSSVPIAMVCIETDKEEITIEEGQRLAEQLNIGYYETTIKDKQKVSQILDDFTTKMLRWFIKSRE